MCTEHLDGRLWLKAVKCGADRLRTYKEEIDNLNVFPIPDGDTGDNMLMTVDAGCTAAAVSDNIGTVAAGIASGALLGARGNSGVILSRILYGIAKGLEGLSSCSVAEFSRAMGKAVAEAYSSVSNPVEGTILTVLKDSVTAAEACGAEDFNQYFETLVEEMSASLERTPDLLPVLKEAGVVDSGGAGLLCIMEGIRDVVKGTGTEGRVQQGSLEDEVSRKTDTQEDKDAGAGRAAVNLDAFTSEDELLYGYCTEFLLRLQNSKVNPESFDESVIRSYLESAGESVVCFREGSIVKVHVHTFRPGDILNTCQQWGEFLTLKIENMTLQHSGKVTGTSPSNTARFARRPRIAVVTVAAGEGMNALFTEAGADVVIEGGQTMNPPVQSFLDAFEKVNAEHILIFPNNSNIILTAEQAAQMYGKSDIHVIKCHNQGTAYVAMASIDRSTTNIEEVLSEIEGTCSSLACGKVSRAIRRTTVDGKDIVPGDALGISGSEIVCISPDRQTAALELCSRMGMGDRDVAIVFRGKDVPQEEADTLVRDLQAAFPLTETILKDAGQPVYDYIFTLC